jgi:D-alanine transaminase
MIVYLNGEYLPADQAKISPLDRGFLFGDGIYEVIPSYNGRAVALQLHIDRMRRGLDAIGIDNPMTDDAWNGVARELSERNGGGNLGIYFHVSRGNEGRRMHRFPQGIAPTVFATVLEIAPPPPFPDRKTEKGFRVGTAEDQRWDHCDIKSTALLGNLLHYHQSHKAGMDETILYNQKGEITEASSSNVFVVIGEVSTPPLDHQKLPGISRHICLESLRSEGSIPVREREVTIEEARKADEIWLTNSSKRIVPVVEMDGRPVGDGQVGKVWEKALRIYEAAQFDF